jgi:hypothetical protein
MTIDDVLGWIEKRIAQIALNIGGQYMTWTDSIKAKLQILEELRHHILMKTNPHNREDIKKFNKKFKDEKIDPSSITYRISCSKCFKDITSYYQNEHEERHVCEKKENE